MFFHFSEDGGITRFVPHVPRTNLSAAAAVWALDEAHSPLYWFPRDCPRVAVWPRNDREAEAFGSAFATNSRRVHVTERAWEQRMKSCHLYRYTFDPAPFAPWPDADGQYIATEPVTPVAVEDVGNLFEAHRAAHIDLRLVDDLTEWRALALQGPWDFSIVRYHNAQHLPAE